MPALCSLVLGTKLVWSSSRIPVTAAATSTATSASASSAGTAATAAGPRGGGGIPVSSDLGWGWCRRPARCLRHLKPGWWLVIPAGIWEAPSCAHMSEGQIPALPGWGACPSWLLVQAGIEQRPFTAINYATANYANSACCKWNLCYSMEWAHLFLNSANQGRAQSYCYC